MGDGYKVYLEVYDRLDAIFESSMMLKDIVGIVRLNKPNMA
jgi:hypothetical protein